MKLILQVVILCGINFIKIIVLILPMKWKVCIIKKANARKGITWTSN